MLGDAEELIAGRVETSSGFDVTQSSWSAYSTAVIAPFGPLHADGLRLKLYGSYGAWSYDTRRVYCALPREEQKKLTGVSLSADCDALATPGLTPAEREAIEERAKPLGLELSGDQLYHGATYQVQRYDLAVMPGWQAGWSGLALKGYLGPAMETRQVLPLNPEKALSGASWGAKTALESWMALGSSAWLTADASYFTGTEAYTGTLRLGWQALSWLTLGPETAAFGDEEDDSTRAGGFLRIDLGKSEATFSGGWSSDYDGDASLYGQASVYMRF